MGRKGKKTLVEEEIAPPTPYGIYHGEVPIPSTALFLKVPQERKEKFNFHPREVRRDNILALNGLPVSARSAVVIENPLIVKNTGDNGEEFQWMQIPATFIEQVQLAPRFVTDHIQHANLYIRFSEERPIRQIEEDENSYNWKDTGEPVLLSEYSVIRTCR